MERWFHLRERGTSVGIEVRAGITTFLTMAYILFANPAILQAAGMPFEGVVVATALASGLASLAMGLFANMPIALASGMGLNAFLAYTVVLGQGLSWQTAMGLVFLDGLLVLLLVAAGLREAVMRALPLDLKRAIGAGIGLFIAFIGLVNARLVTVAPGTVTAIRDVASPADWPALPPVTFGDPTAPGAAVALFGLVLTGVLLVRRIPGALLWGIVAGTLLALGVGVAGPPEALAAPSLATIGQLDLRGALQLHLVPLLLALLLVDFFDTMGTVTAVAEQAGLVDERGNLPRLGRMLGLDAAAAMLGGFCGCSSVTSYVESAAGVAEGGRTGLTAVVVGVLFLASSLLAPLAGVVPAEATAPALILVGFLMLAGVTEIDFRRLETAIPAFLTLILIPLTYSIARGIGYGVIAYVLLALLTGRGRQVGWVMVVVALVFAISFAVLPAG